MKLALLFLVCFVAVSLQQQQTYLAFLQPRIFFYPVETSFSKDDSLLDPSKVGLSEDGMTQSRASNSNNNRWWNPSNTFQKIRPRRPALGNYLYNSGPGGYGYISRPTFDLLNPFTPASYRTSMLTSTTTSTVLAASVVSCIPSSLFSSGATAISCRRRRQVAEIMDLIEGDNIEPSAIQPVEPTSIMMTNNHRNWQNIDINSSKDEDDDIHNPGRRYSWFNNIRNSEIVTYTSTSTSFIFSSTLIMKRVSLVSQQSALICIPSGYSVCL